MPCAKANQNITAILFNVEPFKGPHAVLNLVLTLTEISNGIISLKKSPFECAGLGWSANGRIGVPRPSHWLRLLRHWNELRELSEVLGGGGNDTIAGKGGDDTLKGNGGADVFQFRTSDRNDTIADFRQGQDKIQNLSLIHI